MRTRAWLLVAAAGLYLLQPAYERLHLLLSGGFHGWLPVGFLLFRPAALPLGLSIPAVLTSAFVALCLPLLMFPELSRPVLTAGLVLLVIELPVDLGFEAYRVTRGRLSIDYLSTAASLPVCVLLLLVMWRVRALDRDNVTPALTILRTWLLFAYLAIMAKPGVVAM